MNASFEEIGHLAVTFAVSDGLEAGQVCMVSESGTVAGCADGEVFCGVAEGVRGGHGAVQVEGFVQVSVTGTVSVGYTALCADGSGGVRMGEGREYLVVSVDESAGTAVIKL